MTESKIKMRHVSIAEGRNVLHVQPAVTDPKIKMRQGLIVEGHVLHAQPAVTESKIKMRQVLTAVGQIVLYVQLATIDSKIKTRQVLTAAEHVLYAVNICIFFRFRKFIIKYDGLNKLYFFAKKNILIHYQLNHINMASASEGSVCIQRT